MIDKEIIIDGVIYNKCNGCSLYDGNVCTGARTYEDNAERDKRICDEHLASEFWVVFKQLKRKNDKYKQALDEIEYQIKELFLGVENKDRPYCENVLDIINKVKN